MTKKDKIFLNTHLKFLARSFYNTLSNFPPFPSKKSLKSKYRTLQKALDLTTALNIHLLLKEKKNQPACSL